MTGALALALLAPAEAQELHRYALVVGANDGGEGRTTLRYAVSDAETVAGILESLGGVSDDRATLLVDPDAARLREAFGELKTRIAADPGRTEVVFYYSGHSDEDGLLLGEDLFEYRELRASLDGLGAKVRLAILDSCASGSLIVTKGGTRVPSFLPQASADVGGVAYITSSSADEVAQEGERVGGSYFTHYLASGLLGAADTSGDDLVTLNEAFVFARDETLARTERTEHGPQHASYDFQLSGTSDFVLTDLSQRDASLALAEGVEGHVVVRDDEGHLVAELDKPVDERRRLALPAGSYEVLVLPTGASRVMEARTELAQGATVGLEPATFTWTDAESAIARGDAPSAEITSATSHALPARVMWSPTIPEALHGTDTMAWGMWSGRSDALDGVAFGTLSYVVDGEARVFVGSVGYTSVGELRGLETSVGVSHARSGTGLQVAMGANVVDEGFDGAQASLVLNDAEGGINGLQVATGVNRAAGGVNGWQASAVANVAGERSEGVQLASGINVARDLDGVQLALVNVGRDVDGLQLALVNTARDVRGVQLGLVNVAHSVKGTPIGLFSFVEEGRHGLMLYASESDWANVEGRFGGGHLYTLVGVGLAPDRHAYASYGVGLHATTGKAWFDADTALQAYVPESSAGLSFADPPTGVVRGRATLGFQVTKGFAPFLGASLAGRLPEGEAELLQVSPFGDADLWPGVFAGIQLF